MPAWPILATIGLPNTNLYSSSTGKGLLGQCLPIPAFPTSAITHPLLCYACLANDCQYRVSRHKPLLIRYSVVPVLPMLGSIGFSGIKPLLSQYSLIPVLPSQRQYRYCQCTASTRPLLHSIANRLVGIAVTLPPFSQWSDVLASGGMHRTVIASCLPILSRYSGFAG